MRLANNVLAMETMNTTILAETIMNNTTEIDGVRLASVPVTLFAICDEYQRPVDAKHVDTLAKDFNKTYANCIVASYREGKFYIIDGQHRYHAALIKGIKSLACIIVTGLTVKDEAKMFKELNINHKKPDPYKLFKANICNGDMSDPEVAIDMHIKKTCDKHHIEVKKFGRGSTGKTLRCLSRARMIVGSATYDGAKCFEWIIDFLNTTDWADVSASYTREIILMMKNFWVDNNGDDKLEKRLFDVINGTTPDAMITGAKHCYPNHGIEPAIGLYLRDLIYGKTK